MTENTIIINKILKNPSLCDGPGYRTVLFLQGCNLRCPGCHNPLTWDINNGTIIDIDELANQLKIVCINKKLTISGGEPLLQEKPLERLLEKLNDFDICLYTGKDIKDVSTDILKHLRYIKYGKYIQSLRTTITPYVGSTNQVFKEIKHYE